MNLWGYIYVTYCARNSNVTVHQAGHPFKNKPGCGRVFNFVKKIRNGSQNKLTNDNVLICFKFSGRTTCPC